MSELAEQVDYYAYIRNSFRTLKAAEPDRGIDLKRMPKEFQPQEMRRHVDPTWDEYVDRCMEAARRQKKKLVFLGYENRVVSPFVVKQILRHVASVYGCAPDDLTGSCRTNNIVVPRHIAFYLVRRLTHAGKQSMPWIGRQFGGKDHTTILSGIRKVERQRAADPQFAAKLDELESEIRAINP